MSIKISDVFSGLISQQIPALIIILSKANAYAQQADVTDEELLSKRLHDDMHPLSWQIQTTLELIQRGLSRLLRQEPASLTLDEDNFEALIKRVESIKHELENTDSSNLDNAAESMFDIPVGPEAVLSMTGQDYVLKFLLPNVYFHLTTSYDLLRVQGVPVGKRDFMGPF